MNKKNILLKIFPTPVFLKETAAGLDISDSSIRIVEFKNEGNRMIIKKIGKIDIPQGVISPNKDVKRREDLIDILKKIKDDFSLDFVNVAVSEKVAYLFTAKIPNIDGMTDDEIRSSIEFQLEENVPVPASAAIFDYEYVDDDDKEKKDGNQRDVVVSVLSESVISDFTDVLESAGLEPLSLEIETNSVARAVIPYDDKGLYMIVDFGNVRTSLSIVEKNIVLFSTTIDVGGDDLTRIIQKKKNIDFAEADKFKRENGLNKNKMDEDLFLSLFALVSVIRDEVNKYYDYWTTKDDKDGRKDITDRGILKIILCGESSGLDGFYDSLSLGAKAKVEMSDVWVNAFSVDDYLPSVNFSESLGFVIAIGLALRNKI